MVKIISDLHIHSKYSRATSSKMDIPTISQWCVYKGLKLVGTGDFTHPLWLGDIKTYLKPAGYGFYQYNDIYFILTAEVNNIYTKNNKIRRIHNIIFVPSIEIAEKLNKKLSQYGNLLSDGRPILRLDSEDLLEILLDISPDIVLIPAHIWTPHFSLFGSLSGFDSIEECFGKYTKYIFAVETGLSSDPSMNWRLSSLDRITLISNSDAHSPSRLGREANVFEIDNINDIYREIIDILKTKNKKKFLFTIEFFPEEGKYHYDGHRFCQVCLSPQEAISKNNICPNCKRPLTIGVLHRVEELADRPQNYVPEGVIPYKNLISLDEIIAEALNTKKETVNVNKEYLKIVTNLSNEFDILMNISEKDLYKFIPAKIVEGILNMREKKLEIRPGYDGEYGVIKIKWNDAKTQNSAVKPKEEQLTLF